MTDDVEQDAKNREEVLREQADSGEAISIDEFRRKTRRSFLVGGLGIAGALVARRWLLNQPADDGIPKVLRSALETNEAIWTALPNSRSAPEYSIDRANPIQVNGRIGIRTDLETDGYTIRVEGPTGDVLDELTIADIEALPQRDMVIEHKCIEGWSNITHWGGTRFSELHKRYESSIGDAKYVGLETPDGGYYVGWDLEPMLHPQTLLALRLDGKPLDEGHGAPLRLATPNKYGIKCLKRIGVIRYSHERTPDYWAERSYDWYAGL